MKYKFKRLIAYLIDWFISSLIYSFITLLYYSIITQTKTTGIDFYQVTFNQGMIIISLYAYLSILFTMSLYQFIIMVKHLVKKFVI